jgi:prepilin-type processing-associated H-X9-DG protein
MCPTVSTDTPGKTILTHYSSHPRVLPDLSTKDFLRDQLGNTGLKSYKLAKLKRPAEIAAVFDATLNPAGGFGQWIAFACGFGLDKGGVTARKPYLTDNYQIAVTPTNGSQPVDMTPNSLNVAFTNMDHDQNQGNIRFRHARDTQANALMLDGHVETFNYNPKTRQTDLLRKNVYVTP